VEWVLSARVSLSLVFWQRNQFMKQSVTYLIGLTQEPPKHFKVSRQRFICQSLST